MCLVHLEEESARRDKDEGSEDPNSIDGVTEEFMVHLARAVRDNQTEEKCCYHCSSPEPFHPQLTTHEDLEEKYAVKLQGGDGIEEGSLDPSDKNHNTQEPPGEVPKV